VGCRAVGEDGEKQNPVVPDPICKAVATVKSEVSPKQYDIVTYEVLLSPNFPYAS
jgi:hypothetical protein